MALNAGNLPSNRKPVPVMESGAYPARLVQVIGLGLQKQEPFKQNNGEEKEKAPAHEVYTTYELSDEFMVDDEGSELRDKPRWISETLSLFPLDSDRANSTKRYYALDPDGEYKGDWAKLLSFPVMLTLITKTAKSTGNDYNKIGSTSSMRAKEATKLPELVNPAKVFDPDEPNMEIFFSLPQWLQDKIKDNLQYGGSALEKLVEAGPKSSESKTTKKAEKATPAPAQEVSDVVEDEEDEEDW
jgi:hypothetical protein